MLIWTTFCRFWIQRIQIYQTYSNATNQTQNMVDNDQTREVVVEEMEENRDQDET